MQSNACFWGRLEGSQAWDRAEPMAFVSFPSQFVYCQVCCEPFHKFCLEESERPLQDQLENWCCRRCKFCHVCGRQHQATKVAPTPPHPRVSSLVLRRRGGGAGGHHCSGRVPTWPKRLRAAQNPQQPASADMRFAAVEKEVSQQDSRGAGAYVGVSRCALFFCSSS